VCRKLAQYAAEKQDFFGARFKRTRLGEDFLKALGKILKSRRVSVMGGKDFRH